MLLDKKGVAKGKSEEVKGERQDFCSEIINLIDV
jgi:hypothetical protein